MRRHDTAGGIEMLFNLEVLIAKLRAEMEAEGADAMADNPLGITPEALFDGLALDVFRAGWLTVRPAPDATEPDPVLPEYSPCEVDSPMPHACPENDVADLDPAPPVWSPGDAASSSPSI